MRSNVTDAKKKRIIADYTEMESYRAVGRKHGLSATTIRNIVQANPDALHMCADKKAQNTVDMITYLDSIKGEAQRFIGACIREMNQPGRLEKARLSEITTAMGTTIDKFVSIARMNESALEKLDQIVEGLNRAAKQ